MDIEILKNHRFQFIRLVVCHFTKCLEKSRINFNDHSNLVHVINGRGKVFFGSKAYPLERGTVIALPAFVECCFEREPGIEVMNVHYSMWNSKGEVMEDLKKLPLVFKPDYFEYCEAILKEMRNLEKLPPGESLRIEPMAHEIVLKHYASNPLLSPAPGLQNDKMRIIYKMLQSQNCVRYDPKRMAKTCFLSVSQMNRKFKQYFGEPPRKFWERNKFNNICRALQENNKSVTEIGNDFAFSYQSHFSKWFKRIARISPAEYRSRSSGEADFRL